MGEAKKTNEQLQQEIKSLRKELADRKQSEEKLHMLSGAVEQSREGIAIAELNGNLLFVNDSFARMHDYTPDELIGKHLSVFHISEQMSDVDAAFKQIIEEGEFSGELWHARRDGTVFPTMMHNSLLKDENGNKIGILGTASDITEQKRIEHQLRESEQNFRQLAENIQEVFWICTPDWSKVIYISETFEAIFGIPCRDVYKEPKAWRQHVLDQDREKVFAKLMERFPDNLPFIDIPQYRIKHPDGSIRWIKSRIFPIKDQDNKVYRVAGIAEDITEQKQAELQLRVSEQNFRQLTDNIQEVFWIEEPDWSKAFYISKAFETMFGLPCQEIYKNPKAWRRLVLDQDKEMVFSAIPDRFPENCPVIDIPQYRIKRSDGSIRWIKSRIFPIKDQDNKVYRAAGIAEDITEQKQVELQLRESGQQFRQLADNIPGMVYSANPDWSAEIVSGCEEVCGYTVDELNALDQKWLSIVHPDDRKRIDKEGSDLRTRPCSIVEIYRIICKKGNIRWVEDRKTSRHKDGELIGIDGVVFDITQRKNTEEALRKSEEHLRSIILNLPTVIWTSDSKGNTTFISDNIKEVYGYTPEEIYKDGEELWFNRIHPDDVQRVKDGYERLFSEDIPFNEEYRIKRKDGKWIWLHDRASVYREKENIRYAYGVFSDVTERKIIEQNLKDSEEKLLQLTENLQEVFWVITPDYSQCLYISPAFEKVWGIPCESFYKDPGLWAKAVVKEDLQMVIDDCNKKIAEGYKDPDYPEFRIKRPDGSIRWIKTRAFPIMNESGEIYRVAGIYTDITERKKTEKELKYLRDFENLITEISTKFINLSAERTDDGINDALEALGEFADVDKSYVFRFSDDLKFASSSHLWCKEGFDLKIEDFQNMPSEDFSWSFDKLKKFETVHISNIDELPKKAKNEKKFLKSQNILSIVVSPLVYEKKLIGFIGFESLTKEKKWDNESVNLLRIVSEIFVNTLMRSEIHQKLQSYQNRMFRAEQLASLGMISAAIAHELNQPLTVMNLFLQQIQREVEDSGPEKNSISKKAQECLDEIKKAVSIVERFRKFSRKSSPHDFTKVDIVDITKRTLAVLAESALKAKLDITISSGKGPVFVRGNIADFEQMIFILCQNSIQAADKKAPRSLKISLKGEKDRIKLIFADTCGGVPEEDIKKIFEPFFTTKPAGKGTGLGLSILERIVKRYGGSINIKNKPERGITFNIILPLSD